MRSAKLLILVLCIISCQQNDKSEIESYENEISKLNSVIAEKESLVADLADALKAEKIGSTAIQQVGSDLNAFEQLLEAQINLNEYNSQSMYNLTSYEFLSPNLVSAQYSDGHNYIEKKLSLYLFNNTLKISQDSNEIK
tara:strand:- start:4924 stop:5340 length:417 start_codon:yes stop_codon:yes gene_type:complete